MNALTWPQSIAERLGLQYPLVQAPMAGAAGVELAVAVANGGGLGSLPCAMLTVTQIEHQVAAFRTQASGPLNLNFFCHQTEVDDAVSAARWLRLLQPYYAQYEVEPTAAAGAQRLPFNAAHCELIEALQPSVVSFHFGLPREELLQRVKSAGVQVMSSATTVAEAQYLEAHGADVVIAQGSEAGGHRGMFLTGEIANQVGTMALLPQVVDAVSVPVIAAGGIGDARGVLAARVLGASGVQMGSAFLRSPQARISAIHRDALAGVHPEHTALTNLFSGKPARGVINRLMREIGPMSAETPAFPNAGVALAALKKAAESQGKNDFSALWSGQAVALSPADIDAGTWVAQLMTDVEAMLAALV